MITVRGTVTTPLSADKAFSYLSEFEHTSEWDPGTPEVEKLSQGPARVGHRYHAEAEFRGKRQPIQYEVTELRNGHIKLRGENKSVISFDSIDVVPSGSGSTVTYTAEFEMKGWLKYLQPVLKTAFNSLRDPAMNGLRTKLDSLASS